MRPKVGRSVDSLRAAAPPAAALPQGDSFLKTALSATEQRTLALAKASNRATLNNLSRLARVGHTTFCADAKVGGCGRAALRVDKRGSAKCAAAQTNTHAYGVVALGPDRAAEEARD